MRQKTDLTKISTIDTRTEAQKKIDAIKNDIPVLIEVAKFSAEIAWTQFEALTKQGFTETQAIEIITKQPAWK